MYSVKILKDSVNPRGVRLVSWELTYPRIVHAELMTHRVFSRSSASSRAIPAAKMRANIEKDPFVPIRWLANQSGMQGFTEISKHDQYLTERVWLKLRDYALEASDTLSRFNVHKGIVNRVTEPWMWITVIMSTTCHANWFALRDHKMAEIHLAHFAEEMHRQYWTNKPTLLDDGEWHMPYMNDVAEIIRDGYSDEDLKSISVGRCARVSYLNHDGVRDPLDDLRLCNETLKSAYPPHMAPFEHVAQSTNTEDWFGNFQGFKQYRKFLPNEAGPPEPRFDRDGNCTNYDMAERLAAVGKRS